MADIIERAVRALQDVGAVSSDFDLNSDVVLPADRKLRNAAVLAAVRPHQKTLILTKRSSALKHHPGQIAFPGGKQDPEDATLEDTALREAEEEIGLPSKSVELIGELPKHETVTSFLIQPCVGLVHGDFSATPEAGEVDEVFEVPLAHVLNPQNFLIQSRRWRGAKRHYFAVPYGPYYIWGATARMLRSWAEATAAQN